MTNDLVLPQPEPIHNDQPATWDLVMEDIKKHVVTVRDGELLVQLMTTDARDRNAHGIGTYGTPLQPHNGRDSLVDAYQEGLDYLVYLRNAHVEASPAEAFSVFALCKDALGSVAGLRWMIYRRDGK